jgi:DNA-binding transcriptional MerR regulator
MTTMGGMLIGHVADRAGVPTATIRYYESIGLLKRAPRSASGYRRYPEQTVDEIAFIKKAQALGFSLDEVAGILELSRTGRTPCARVLSLGHQHLATVDARIRQLQTFRDQLATELAKWDEQKVAVTCAGLCQFIASADLTVPAEMNPRSESPRRRVKAT